MNTEQFLSDLAQAASSAASGARGLMHMISQGRRHSSDGAAAASQEAVRTNTCGINSTLMLWAWPIP